MEGFVLGKSVWPIRWIDGQAPGQVGWAAKELLVKPVTPSPDSLSKGHSRRDRIGQRRQEDPGPSTSDPGTERSPGHGTPNAKTTIPDLEGSTKSEPVRPEVRRVVRRDVIKPGSDDPKWHRPQRDVGDKARFAASGNPASISHPDRNNNPDQDAQCVRPYWEGSQIPHPRTGAWNEGGQLDAHWQLLLRCLFDRLDQRRRVVDVETLGRQFLAVHEDRRCTGNPGLIELSVAVGSPRVVGICLHTRFEG